MTRRPSRSALMLVIATTLGCGARTGLDTPVGRAAVDAFSIDAARLDAGIEVRAPDGGLDTSVPQDVGLDAVEAPDDAFAIDAGDPCEIGPDPLREPVCTRPLFGRMPTLSCPGGFVDVAAQGDGTLAWECGGSRAEARFGERVYRGQRTGDRIALCIRTEFDYVDGCRWQTSQRIEGDTRDETVDLTYREVAITSDGSCFPPCTADSLVEVR